MTTQRNRVAAFLKEGKIREALKIAKGLDKTFNSEELGVLRTAYECINGSEKFYKQMGVDVEAAKIEAEQLMRRFEDS